MERFVLSPCDTLRNAVSKIDILDEKMCVVCGADSKILWTITDGDIRRFLLAGGSMDDTLDALPEKAPVVASQGASDSELIQKLKEHEVQVILLVDEAGVPVQMRSRASLESKIMLAFPQSPRAG